LTRSKSANTVQSIERAVAILRSFSEAEPELRVTELARRLELHKSTVSRILTTLQAAQLVSQNPETSKYRLGVGLVSLAGIALGRLDVRGVAQPHLNALVELSQETINVTIIEERECVNIERVASPKPIRYVGWIGRRTPLHCTAAGKVLLAFRRREERQRLIQSPLVCYTENTIVDPAALEASLAQIQKQGYAIVHEEFEPEFSAIAAPIYDHLGHAAAAVSISGPTYRLAPGQIENFIEPLLETTGKISAGMGYQGVAQPLAAQRAG
jgi:IclR family KDG regulon transcriptional repressor